VVGVELVDPDGFVAVVVGVTAGLDVVGAVTGAVVTGLAMLAA
jgi:hypothetical protein